MPNVAAALGLGVFLFVPGTLGERGGRGRAALRRWPERSSCSTSREFDSATAVAGCMPGMLALLVRDFGRAGERRGLDAGVARRLAIAGVHGAAAVIAREGDPDAVDRRGGHARAA